MSDLAWVYFQIFFIFWRYQRRNAFSFALCLCAFSLLPGAVLGDRTAFVDVSGAEKTAGKERKENGLGQPSLSVKIKGSFASAGAVSNQKGQVHSVSFTGNQIVESVGKGRGC